MSLGYGNWRTLALLTGGLANIDKVNMMRPMGTSWLFLNYSLAAICHHQPAYGRRQSIRFLALLHLPQKAIHVPLKWVKP